MAEPLMNDLEPAIRRAVHLFMERVTDRYLVTGALLFGSRARGSHRPDSDADIALVLTGPRGDFIGTKLAMADVAYDVLLETGVLIQPFPVWEEEWQHPEHHANPTLLAEIRREGVRL